MPRKKGEARYRCRGCGHEWRGRSGPVTCPKCPHTYIDWLNAQEMAHRHGWYWVRKDWDGKDCDGK